MCGSPGADPGFPIGGVPTLIGGGANLRHRHFSVKTYVKMKEFGPVGGGGGARRKLLYVDPPLVTLIRNELNNLKILQVIRGRFQNGSTGSFTLVRLNCV